MADKKPKTKADWRDAKPGAKMQNTGQEGEEIEGDPYAPPTPSPEIKDSDFGPVPWYDQQKMRPKGGWVQKQLAQAKALRG
jgi:hypothetical protein